MSHIYETRFYTVSVAKEPKPEANYVVTHKITGIIEVEAVCLPNAIEAAKVLEGKMYEMGLPPESFIDGQYQDDEVLFEWGEEDDPNDIVH